MKNKQRPLELFEPTDTRVANPFQWRCDDCGLFIASHGEEQLQTFVQVHDLNYHKEVKK